MLAAKSYPNFYCRITKPQIFRHGVGELGEL